MSSFLVSRGSSYLEWTPADKAFSYLAGSQEHATPFTEAAATVMAELHSGRVVPDYRKREPEFDVEDLDGDDVCHRHGKVKPMSEYGIRYGGCEDCEPREVTYDEALGARCDEQQRMEAALKVKYGR
jgi:hypothetical protein